MQSTKGILNFCLTVLITCSFVFTTAWAQEKRLEGLKPVFEIQPTLPLRATESGFCQIKFDVTDQGKTTNVIAEECSDVIYEKVSIDAIKKRIYLTEAGLPKKALGLKEFFDFKVDNSPPRSNSKNTITTSHSNTQPSSSLSKNDDPNVDKEVDQFCKIDRHLFRSALSKYEYTANGIRPDKKTYTNAYIRTNELKKLFKEYDRAKRASGRPILEAQIKDIESRYPNVSSIQKRVAQKQLKKLKRRLKTLDKGLNSPDRIQEKISLKIIDREKSIDVLMSSYETELNKLPNELLTIGYFESAFRWGKLSSECLKVSPTGNTNKFIDKNLFFRIKDYHREIERRLEAKSEYVLLRNINATPSPFLQGIKKMPYSQQKPLYDRLYKLIDPASLQSSNLRPIMSAGFRDDLQRIEEKLNEKHYILGFFQVAKNPWNNQAGPFLSEAQLALTKKLEREQIRLANKAFSLSPEVCTTTENVVRLRQYHYAPLHVGKSTFCVPQIEVGMKVLRDEFRAIDIDRLAIETECSKELKPAFCKCLAKKADGHFSQLEYDALISDPLAFIRYISIIDGMDAGEEIKGYLTALQELVQGNFGALADLSTTLALSAPNHAETLSRSCR